MSEKDLIGAMQAYQLVHDQTGGNIHIDMKNATIDIRVNALPDFAVSDALVAPIFKDRHKIGKKDGLLPEFMALFGTGEAPEQLPLKRFALDQKFGKLVDMAMEIPTAELLKAFGKSVMPFKSFWVEMPYQDLKTGARLRYAHWCQVEEGTVISKNYYWLWAGRKTENGLQAIQFAEPERFSLSAQKLDILDIDLDGRSEEKTYSGIEILTKRAKRLLAALVILGSPRFNAQAFAPETPEGQIARLEEYRKNRSRMRLGRPPLLPLHPITIEVGPRLETAVNTGNIKEAKSLLGITSVREHPVRIKRANGQTDIIKRRAHDRHFPADEPIDRRSVVRQVTVPGLPDLTPLRPVENIPALLMYQPKNPGGKK